MALTRHVEIKPKFLLIVFMLLGFSVARGQSDPERVAQILGSEILPPAVAKFQIRQYLINRIAPPPKVPPDAKEWTSEAARLRHHLLDDVVFHGWPKEWVNSPPKFEDAGIVETGDGYRIHKLRYEVVPGFEAAALLYEPQNVTGKVPAILNLNGHDPLGKAVEYKQKRCIYFAKHGILALSLEWPGFGQLSQKGNSHWFGAHLDLVGANELGFFYLEMRRGLDYLYDNPDVDRKRIGVTGLSGGGWQTIVLSSLDERVRVAVPVAGFSSARSRLEANHYGDMGDVEQWGTDFLEGTDYTDLAAMMAPRPTLLVYNAEDNCCFRAELVKPLVYEAIRPFFKLYGKEGALGWHENMDPSTHNYQLDNRLAAYRFFGKHFGISLPDNEDHIASEIKSYNDLLVDLPKDNLTMLALAQKLGKEITREPIPPEASARTAWAASQRTKLRQVVRYAPVRIEHSWGVATTKDKGLQSIAYLFQMSNGLSGSAVWMRAIRQSADTAPVTIVLDDKGKEAASQVVSDRVNRGEQVLAVDLMFYGAAWKKAYPFLFAQILDGIGDRPVGMEAAQLISIANWARTHSGVSKVRLEADGIRTQEVALVAASIEPELFSEIVIRDGMHSLSYVLGLPVPFDRAPELFCLDFYKDFDIDQLESLAAPTEVLVKSHVEIASK